MVLDIQKYKTALEKESGRLTKELRSVGRINPSNPGDWEPTPGTIATDPADENEVADSIEEYEENTGILKQLEIQYNEVKNALERIEKGTYGICSIGGEEIETDRLDANPSATTCKQHIEKAS